MEILNNIDKSEVVKENFKYSVKASLKNSLMANLLYVILWVAFDAFFIYLISLKTITQEFWLVLIPVCGFNLLIVWVYIFKMLKEYANQKNAGYVLTEKALYYYQDGLYKQLIKINLQDIAVVEKSEYIYDGFYVASLDSFIYVKNIQKEKELFNMLIEIVKNV